MEGNELDKLLIKVDSELGDLDAIDKAIEQLGRLKDFGKDASKGIQQLAEFGKALKNFHGLGTTLKGLDNTAEGIHRMIDILERLGGASKYTRPVERTMKDLGKSLDISKEVSSFENDIKRLDKAIDKLKNPKKSTKSTDFKMVDTESIRKQNETLRKEIEKGKALKEDAQNTYATRAEKAAVTRTANQLSKKQQELAAIEKSISDAQQQLAEKTASKKKTADTKVLDGKITELKDQKKAVEEAISVLQDKHQAAMHAEVV